MLFSPLRLGKAAVAIAALSSAYYMSTILMRESKAAVAQTTIVAATAPNARTTIPSKVVTGFATIVNATGIAATGCSISLPNTVPATFLYQTTNPATNLPTGKPNTPADIVGNGSQSFYFAITPTTTFSRDIPLVFQCTNSAPATSVFGLNTFLVTSASTQLADMVSIAATTTRDGIVTLPTLSGTGAFATASINIGTAGSVTFAPSVTPFGQPARSIPVTLLVCPTSAVGQCLQPASSSVTLSVATNQVLTFTVFAQGQGMAIPFDPANTRVFLIASENGAPVGEASVAVRTAGGGTNTVEVDLQNFSFTPQAVSIKAGDTVHWVWKASNHTVTADSGAFDSGVQQSSATFDQIFPTAGTFRYFCQIHGGRNGVGMSGEVVVSN